MSDTKIEFKEPLKAFPDSEIIEEVHRRNLEDEFEGDISEFNTWELEQELSTRKNTDSDKDQIIDKYYDQFTWQEMNALFKPALARKKSGEKLSVDYSLLEGEVIS